MQKNIWAHSINNGRHESANLKAISMGGLSPLISNLFKFKL